MNFHPRILSAASMIGSKVVNPEGEQLGNIKDLVIDLDDAQIAYAVLSFGGFLGLGDKLFAIPLEALAFDTRENRVVLEVDRETLQKAPGFDKDKWPDTAQFDAGWLLEIYEYYGYSPYWIPGKQEGRSGGRRTYGVKGT